MTRAYYNEFDPGAARWLRELMHEGLIPAGDVDERSIHDVRAEELRGYVQVHFCAGIGVWPHALRRAGWEDDRPVGTGSFPCQPFSAAGKGGGFDDPRHIWPEGYRLIRDARRQGQRWAYTLFGEQAATAGAWVDLVRSDLEGLGYAFAAVDLPAAGFGGAHIRQRFYWVADAYNAEWWADHAPRHDGDWPDAGRAKGAGDAAERGAIGGLADADGGQPWIGQLQPGGQYGLVSSDRGVVDWLLCRDGFSRPVEGGTFPLVDEAPGRLGCLRGYGNALDAEVATNFVAAFREAAGERVGVLRDFGRRAA